MNRHQPTRTLSFSSLEELDGRVLPSHVFHPLPHSLRHHPVHRATHAPRIVIPSQTAIQSNVQVAAPTAKAVVAPAAPAAEIAVASAAPAVVRDDPTGAGTTATTTVASTPASAAATATPGLVTSPSGTFNYGIVNLSDGGAAMNR